MGRNETEEHKRLKEIMENRLNQWFGGYAITEYPSSGHELDCYSVTYEGIKILVEVIWTSTRTQFFEDINIMMSNSANVKIAIVNPIILQKQDLVRHYKKISIAEAEKGYLLSELIDGKRILGEENYLDSEIRNHIFSLIKDSTKTEDRFNERVSKLGLAGKISLFSVYHDFGFADPTCWKRGIFELADIKKCFDARRPITDEIIKSADLEK